MVFQTIPPECPDFAFDVQTHDKRWSSNAYDQNEARKAAAVQQARKESIEDKTIKRIDKNKRVDGDPFLVSCTTEENGVKVHQYNQLPKENQERMNRRMVTSDNTQTVNV